jgi:hypothetical protein
MPWKVLFKGICMELSPQGGEIGVVYTEKIRCLNFDIGDLGEMEEMEDIPNIP